MDAWVLPSIVVPSLLAIATCALFVRLSFSWSIVAKGEPSGAWALVCGGDALGVSVTFVAAEGVPAHVVVFVLGRRLHAVTVDELRAMHARRSAKPKKPRKRKPARTEPTGALAQLTELYQTIAAWMDPVDALAALWSEHRRLRLAWLNIETRYGFRDPILTGQITGLLYILDTFLPTRVRLVASPDWNAEDRFSLSLEGRAWLWPGLFAVDMARLALHAAVHRVRFALAHRRLRALASPETTSPPGVLSPAPSTPPPSDPPSQGD